MRVKDVYSFLDEWAPYDTQMSYDNSGLNIGSPDNVVSGVMVALDCTEDVIDEAEKRNDNLIVTHHPIIFHGLKSISPADIPYSAIKNDLNCLSCHTNLDMADGGVNDCLCGHLGIVNVEKMICLDGTVIRRGEFADCFSDDRSIAEQISKFTHAPVKFIDKKSRKKIKSVAVCGGSGGDLVDDVYRNNIDTFITGEAKHSEILRAESLGVSLFVIGHYESERVIVREIYDRLKEKFDINIDMFDKTNIATVFYFNTSFS